MITPRSRRIAIAWRGHRGNAVLLGQRPLSRKLDGDLDVSNPALNNLCPDLLLTIRTQLVTAAGK
jgi:hypothetical protein